MYDIIFANAYSLSHELIQTLDRTWLEVNLAHLDDTQAPDPDLIALTAQTHESAQEIFTHFADQATSNTERLHRAIASNLTLRFYLSRLAEELTKRPHLKNQAAALNQAVARDKQNFDLMIEQASIQYSSNQQAIIERRILSARSFISNHLTIDQEDLNHVNELRRRLFERINLWEQEIPGAIAYWKHEIALAHERWTPTPLLSAISGLATSSHSQTSSSSSSSSSSTQHLSPSQEAHRLRIKKIVDAFCEQQADLQKKEAVIDKLSDLIPATTALDEEKLTSKIKPCLQIRHESVRFVSKRLAVLHLDEALLLENMEDLASSKRPKINISA